MTDHDDDRYERLEDRISRLEDNLEQLQQRLDQRNTRRPRHRSDTSRPDRPDRPDTGDDAPDSDDASTEDQSWFTTGRLVDKIGVALLLIGLGFLYHLSVERGWITPLVRVAFGTLLGTGLATVGWRIRTDRRRLGQILVGAGSVAFYITLYAAHEFYDLIPYSLTFGAMTAVVVATFVVADTERDPALAVVATLGGFTTPVILSSDGSVPGLMTYTAILAAGMSAIYLVRGWRSVLALTALGGWTFVAFAAVSLSEGSEQLYTQAGLIVVWFCTGVAPAIRTWLWADQLDDLDELPTRLAALLALVSGLLGYGLTLIVWNQPAWLQLWGGLALAGVAAGVSVVLARRLSGLVVSAHRMLAAIFTAIALAELTPDGHFLAVLPLLAVAIHLVATFHRDRLLRHLGHLTAFVAVAGFVYREGFTGADPALPFATIGGLQGALLVACAFAVSFVVSRDLQQGPYHRGEALLYRWAGYGLVMLYVVFEARPFDYGNALVSGVWGAYGLVLVVAGLLAGHRQLERAGLAAVLLTVAKLFFVDLATLELIWRVLFFMGFGAALLAVGYYAPSLNSADDVDAADDPDD